MEVIPDWRRGVSEEGGKKRKANLTTLLLLHLLRVLKF